MDYEKNLLEQYCNRREKIAGFPKSHWVDCSVETRQKIELPNDAPAIFISCNTCLIRRGYIRIMRCNPFQAGWPITVGLCKKCDYGIDHKTWLRDKTAGSAVEDIIQKIEPTEYHPVTWKDAGLVPLTEYDGNDLFDSKEDLDKFYAQLQEQVIRFFFLDNVKDLKTNGN